MPQLTERLADLAGSAFLDTARVTSVGRLSEHVVTVELQCDAFRSATWTPGAKLQFRPRRGTLTLRTYTPFDWDHVRGTAQLIAYTHGDGPASEWFGRVRIGDDCEFTGPRRSIDLTARHDAILFVGDESSLGLACALRATPATPALVLESTVPDEVRGVLDDVGLRDAVVVPRTDDHAALLEAVAGATLPAPYDVVVTGDASAVHAVRRATRGWASEPDHVIGKAYWARGRTGLD